MTAHIGRLNTLLDLALYDAEHPTSDPDSQWQGAKRAEHLARALAALSPPAGHIVEWDRGAVQASGGVPVKIKRERLEELLGLEHSANAELTRAELRELCRMALSRLDTFDSLEASRAERARLNSEPDICSICDKEIVEGEATRAGQVHWDCWEKVRK